MKKTIVFILFLHCAIQVSAQYHGDVVFLDSMPAYNTGNASAFVEYPEMMACIDSANVISIISLENYMLKLYESTDGGQSFVKSSLVTGDEGDFWNAMMTCTRSGQRIIIIGSNPYQNYGANLDPYSTYFAYGAYGYIETPTGWVKTTLEPVGSSNSGYIPFAIHSHSNGLIYAWLHKRGWYTYGGTILEAIYNPATNQWSGPNQIYTYNQTIDRLTVAYAKVVEDTAGNMALIFRKQQATNGSIYELVMLRQTNNTWSGVSPVMLSADYPTSYLTYDVALDPQGNEYFIRLSNPGYGQQGPGLIMCRNSYTNGDTIFPFSPPDTLTGLMLIERPGSTPVLQLFLKNTGKLYFDYDGNTKTLIPLLPPHFPDPADSISYYDWPFIPNLITQFANFGSLTDLFFFHKESQGRNPNLPAQILPMPFKFTRLYMPLATEAEILRFNIPGMLSASVNASGNTITVVMPSGTPFNNLTPDTIELSPLATVTPPAGAPQDFTIPVTYTVKAQDTSITKNWVVTVLDNTGLTQTKPIPFKIWPNPASCTLYAEAPAPFDLILTDLSGRMIKQWHQHKGSIDISSIAPGAYLLISPSTATSMKLIIVR